MALGEFTRQLAQQAIGNQVKDLLETPQGQTAQAKTPEGIGPTIFAQVQAMQKALKEDQELIVLFHSGGETIRVVELFAPSWQVVVITGIDSNKNIARVISPFESLQLVCKPAKSAPPPAKPLRVNFIGPKAKSE
jgi:hypothetical protein